MPVPFLASGLEDTVGGSLTPCGPLVLVGASERLPTCQLPLLNQAQLLPPGSSLVPTMPTCLSWCPTYVPPAQPAQDPAQFPGISRLGV